MKTFLILLAVFFPVSLFANSYTSIEVSGLKIQYVQYDVGSNDYTLKIAISEQATTLTSLARDYNGISGINGAFFCPADYSECGGVSHTINERIINGEDLSFYTDTGERGIFGWDENGSPLFHQTKNQNSDPREDIYQGIGNFPIIFAEGKNMIEVYHDNGLYDNKMKAAMPRHFVCSDKEKTWIRFGRTYSTSLDNLAPVLYDLGCWNALNLDAGNSSKFMYNGRDILSSGRDILDGIVVERNGIDAYQIESDIDSAMKKISPKFKRLNKNISIIKLNRIMELISDLRTEIYNENSVDMYNDSGINIGYSIDIKDLETLKRVYSINILEKKINHLLWEVKNDF